MDSSSPEVPIVINESIKTRENGSSYKEIEYDDGSMETIEITGNET